MESRGWRHSALRTGMSAYPLFRKIKKVGEHLYMLLQNVSSLPSPFTQLVFLVSPPPFCVNKALQGHSHPAHLHILCAALALLRWQTCLVCGVEQSRDPMAHKVSDFYHVALYGHICQPPALEHEEIPIKPSIFASSTAPSKGLTSLPSLPKLPSGCLATCKGDNTQV